MDCIKAEYNKNKLIEELRFLSSHVPEDMCDDDGKDVLEKAADVIETLLVKLDAAIKYIPHTCETCRWWKTVKPGMACCKAPDEAGPCYLGNGTAWEWRGQQNSESN